MRQHTRYMQFRFDVATADKLSELKQKTGLTKSKIFRALIDGASLQELPPLDYHQMTRELHAIGNNLNQIARVANASGEIDREQYIKNATDALTLIHDIKRAVLNG
ncbi:MobC family plasmid mobilization relaxosome protein [Oscillospiraceae bacterium OttesenSCG-928-G22]|nr:MobC family plasmid mobilization relaxosome protein [Oscillospiraceae bacterium OttesenSCG-928-G22]